MHDVRGCEPGLDRLKPTITGRNPTDPFCVIKQLRGQPLSFQSIPGARFEKTSQFFDTGVGTGDRIKSKSR